MADLADLGLSQNIIYETIVCTFNPDGAPNAAPMGTTMQNKQQLVLTVYNSASTLKNLKTTKTATLNLTDNIDIFYQTAFKEEQLPAEWFEKSSIVNAPRLKSANATIAVAITDFVILDSLRTRVVCKVKRVDASKIYPQAYCRAMPAVLEAIIHASRVKVLLGVKEEQTHVSKLINLIQDCSDLVNRSAPNSHYAELMADLQQKIDLWRAKT